MDKYKDKSNDDATDFPTLSLLAGLSLDTSGEFVHKKSLGHSSKKVPKPKFLRNHTPFRAVKKKKKLATSAYSKGLLQFLDISKELTTESSKAATQTITSSRSSMTSSGSSFLSTGSSLFSSEAESVDSAKDISIAQWTGDQTGQGESKANESKVYDWSPGKSHGCNANKHAAAVDIFDCASGNSIAHCSKDSPKRQKFNRDLPSTSTSQDSSITTQQLTAALQSVSSNRSSAKSKPDIPPKPKFSKVKAFGFTNPSLHGSSHPSFPDDFSEPIEPLDDDRDEYYLKNNSQLVSIELSMATMGNTEEERKEVFFHVEGVVTSLPDDSAKAETDDTATEIDQTEEDQELATSSRLNSIYLQGNPLNVTYINDDSYDVSDDETK